MVKSQPWTSEEEAWVCSGVCLAGFHRSIRRGCGIAVIGGIQNAWTRAWATCSDWTSDLHGVEPLFCGTLTICWSPALTCSILSLLSYPQTLLLPSSPLLPLQSLKAGPPHFLWKITHCQYLTWFWHLLPNLLGFACLVKADLNEKRLDILPSPFFFIFAILLTVHYFCRKHV